MKGLLIAALAAAMVAGCSSDEPQTATAAPPTVVAEATATTLPAFPPTWPLVFSGPAIAGGIPVPAGFTIVGRIEDYESQPVTTLPGRYNALTVGPLEERWWDKTVTFHLVAPGGAEVEAAETSFFERLARPVTDNAFALTFPRLP